MVDLKDYDQLLKRAQEKLPDDITHEERFQLPTADVMTEGKSTILRNFLDICNDLRREPTHILQYLQKELGTPGTIQGRRVVFKRRLSEEEINNKIESYTSIYVLCYECEKPDTKMVKEGRVHVLECEACGARSTIKFRGTKRTVQEVTLKEGNVYEVIIQDIGKKGDGVAKLYDKVIFIPGTAKGSKVKVKITNVSGNNAFGVPVWE